MNSPNEDPNRSPKWTTHRHGYVNRQRVNRRLDTLIRRGKNLLNEGDFAGARVLFERAANAGSAEAALELGLDLRSERDQAARRDHGQIGHCERPKMVPAGRGAWFGRSEPGARQYYRRGADRRRVRPEVVWGMAAG